MHADLKKRMRECRLRLIARTQILENKNNDFLEKPNLTVWDVQQRVQNTKALNFFRNKTFDLSDKIEKVDRIMKQQAYIENQKALVTDIMEAQTTDAAVSQKNEVDLKQQTKPKLYDPSK